MLTEVNLPFILLAALLATASPGPATLAIAGTSMNSGRRYGLALASGVMSGSLMWSVSAAFGLGAIMLANAWVFEIVRYMGACYLLYLAFKSIRSALKASVVTTDASVLPSLKAAYAKGLALHLTNPKAILFFGALFSVGMPKDASSSSLVTVITAIAIQSFIVFHGYAFLFSSQRAINVYTKLRRGFETAFGLAFGAAGVKILTTPVE